jgi:hypothetical protein
LLADVLRRIDGLQHPFAAMTGLGRDISRSPDRTGVCRAGRSAPSQCEMVTGPGFSSPNQPDQERTTAYRDSSEPNARSDAHCATIVGDCEQPSGESRLRSHSRPEKSLIPRVIGISSLISLTQLSAYKHRPVS